MTEFGWLAAGSGTYAWVYLPPEHPQIAVKWGQWREDDGWPVWISIAARLGWLGNIAPMVFEFRARGAGYVAIVERLARSYGDPDYSDLYSDDTVQEVMQFLEKSGLGRICIEDISTANVLYRGDDMQTVVNDPLAHNRNFSSESVTEHVTRIEYGVVTTRSGTLPPKAKAACDTLSR